VHKLESDCDLPTLQQALEDDRFTEVDLNLILVDVYRMMLDENTLHR
jgi:hypothetical protein